MIRIHLAARIGKWFLFLLVTAGFSSTPAQELKYEFHHLTVTAKRYPGHYPDINRTITVIDSTDIERTPVTAVQDLFGYFDNLDLQRRGPHGVQSEISIRGGSFQETLVLIDGVRVNNPQTAHHNLNLPLSIHDIGRIEILHGPGSAIYGADAAAGVINFITKVSSNGLNMDAYGGQHGLAGTTFSVSKLNKRFSSRLSLAASRSDGYRYNTNFNFYNLFYSALFKSGHNSITLKCGYNDKKFGANGFYAAGYPDQCEKTSSIFSLVSGQLKNNRLQITPTVSWYRHNDLFLLDFNRPGWFKNEHETNSITVDLPVISAFKAGVLCAGIHVRKEQIFSDNLGDHQRSLGGVYAGLQTVQLSKFLFHGAAHLHRYDRWGWKIWPEIGCSYYPSGSFKLYFSYGQSFRMPSFTELYYTSPANMGNPDLYYSRVLAVELGWRWDNSLCNLEGAVFQKDGRNTIDWVRRDPDSAWRVKNLAELTTNGFEIRAIKRLEFFKWIQKIKISYCGLYSNKETGNFKSKYALNFPRHKINSELRFSLPGSVQFNILNSWQKRNLGPSYSLTDIGIQKLLWNQEIYLNVTNLFNTEYEEITGVPMPGRWMVAGIKLFTPF
ncbi:TonB-dependent receptor [candidate division KSB1 bacterium]|nr:TonB-dependent receptor [candidate division KSB1 bacterium]